MLSNAEKMDSTSAFRRCPNRQKPGRGDFQGRRSDCGQDAGLGWDVRKKNEKGKGIAHRVILSIREREEGRIKRSNRQK